MKVLYKNENDLLEISRSRDASLEVTKDRKAYYFKNINPYSSYPEFIGGKTGRTDQAKESMVSLFNESVPIAIIILRSDFGQREIDTEKLLDMFIEKIQI